MVCGGSRRVFPLDCRGGHVFKLSPPIAVPIPGRSCRCRRWFLREDHPAVVVAVVSVVSWLIVVAGAWEIMPLSPVVPSRGSPGCRRAGVPVVFCLVAVPIPGRSCRCCRWTFREDHAAVVVVVVSVVFWLVAVPIPGRSCRC